MPSLFPTERLGAFLRHFLARRRKSFVCLALISLMWPVEQVMFPYAVKMLVDAFTQFDANRAEVMAAVWPAIILGSVIWGASVLAWRLGDVADYFFSPAFQADIRMEMTEYVFGHSHRFFSGELSGSIANKISDMVRGLHYLVTQSTRFFFPNLITALLTAAVMATISPAFSVILLLWTVVHLAICAAIAPACDQASEAHSELKSEVQGRIVDSIGNFFTVRLFARRSGELSYIRAYQQREVTAHRRLIFITAKVRLLLELPCLVMMALVLYFLLTGWQAGTLSTGDAVFILTTSFNLMYLLWRVGMEFPSFYREIGVCRQALALVSRPHGLSDAPGAKALFVREARITFENVSFEYHPGQNLFEDKNIHIRPGEKIGLVGFSGSGKSTFAHLILRLYDVQEGRILIDGQDIRSVTQDSLHEAIGMIPQEPALFHRSLMDNIRYGKPEANDEEVIAASKAALCDEFIRAMPEGYASTVGERGVKLSGGQRQRIAIARALLKDAPILIMDEATSALDSRTEQLIQERLWPAIEGRTAIVIAHRLSTLARVDRILVFSDGKIIEEGSHAQLLARGGHYAMLWNMQAGGFLPDGRD